MPMHSSILVAASLVALATSASAFGQTTARARLVAGGLFEPVSLAAAPGDDNRLYICERAGRIMTINLDAGTLNPTPFLDLATQVDDLGDGGLIGLTFDPDFANSGLFYVVYNHEPSTDRIIARYHATPGAPTADPLTEAVVWRYPRSIGHNGGWIGFGPLDGLLYLSSGDGGTFLTFDAPNRAQTITNQVLGKILRIDPTGDDFPGNPDRNYRIPPANPFVGATGDDEIWAYGVRNPWRCSFDRLTGDFYIADVGQDEREEINREPVGLIGGRNYGWRCSEGSLCSGLDGGVGCVCGSPALTPPWFEYDHTFGRSITGGYVYRGSSLTGWSGRYIYADFETNRVWSLSTSGGIPGDLREHTSELNIGLTPALGGIASFAEGPQAELYLCEYFSGRVLKIVPAQVCAADINNSGTLTVQDIFDFLNAYFSGAPAADFNGAGGITVQDIFDYLNAYFMGC